MLHLDETDKKYLSGEQFSSIYQFRIKGNSAGTGRIPLIAQLTAGKKVVHFGCVDHLPLIEQRRKAGIWLHDVLSKNCSEVVGVDINQEGIDYMKQAGFEVYNSNVVTENPPAQIVSKQWDYIVAGEVLEHIDDPVTFLKAIREKYGTCTKGIIITVPNALSYTNFRYALRNIEMNNSDHRYWFTPFTLLKVAMQAGIEVEDYDLCHDEQIRFPSVKWWLRNKPLFRNRIVLRGRL
ncbi:MAG: methyltransferase domain-containing protein [Saprospiraceae bacterium]|nr:methyltransferase domain-containing protein [Saprospiraceae bacterium]